MTELQIIPLLIFGMFWCLSFTWVISRGLADIGSAIERLARAIEKDRP